MKKIIILSISFAVLAAGLVLGYIEYNKTTMNSLLMANLEILAHAEDGSDSGEGGGTTPGGGGSESGGDFKTEYDREEGQCSIYVGVKGSIKLFGGTILNADTDGYVKFDGKVVCISGGNKSCTPVECKDLYEAILSR